MIIKIQSSTSYILFIKNIYLMIHLKIYQMTYNLYTHTHKRKNALFNQRDNKYKKDVFFGMLLK